MRTAEGALPLERLLGKASASSLEKHLGLSTVAELLNYFPRRYLNRGELTPINSLPFDEEATLIARVVSLTSRRMRQRKGSITDVVITDDTAGGAGSLRISFFNGWRAEKELRPGVRAMFSGKVGFFNRSLTLTNPDYVLLDGTGDDGEIALAPIPVYPATAKLPSWKIGNAVSALLDAVDLAELSDPLPPEIAEREGFATMEAAYRMIHRPADAAQWQQARDRFRFQEALVLQTALARRRAQTMAQHAVARLGSPDGLLAAFDAALPFTLTAGQTAVGVQISEELAAASKAGPGPMHRLLQGEVGSGKTLVALRAMLQVIDSGGQAALLAPTEVLAAQHYQSIRNILGPLAEGGMLGGYDGGTQVTLLTGTMSAPAKKQALLAAASGQAGIVIGTHALLSDHVQFFDLGLIVVDEQHRFGVEQRDALRLKASHPPHLLVMTATPIPRTVAMTVFGDLETSVLRELPAGRAPISSFVVGLVENPAWSQRIWQRSREEIDAGHQVYVVCPRIGEAEGAEAPSGDEPEQSNRGENRELTSVIELLEQLRNEPALASCRIEAMHGRLDPAEKTRIMADFAAGEVQMLVSTTVIEVGVDVHNATLMVIMDADRFGISQLHQLRGRVGRGGLPGTALLVTELEPEHPSRRRLDAVASTTDGFALSHEDLKLRREGDILGASQSGGRSALRLLRVLDHEQIIEKARADAVQIIADDPELERHTELAEAIELSLNPEKEAFLERG
ncbi:ATP-dependent DNA helicase RecG [Psychromicrobium silvestre]|uniref:Probable DNA 3'-5' helicase RecG n=1 Tax=Psychromicrobium silvestre TaxID=1645614 RepID=A0A7Y9LS94_9MICC|nr:ATP-dependent DNA helicase RecG [Psychromicrobium silvestre]NYE94635.1 ATP-dependent DNA helicase RecG [Psychromicrobium silvestre]